MDWQERREGVNEWWTDILRAVKRGRPRRDTLWDYSVVVVTETRSSRIAKTYQEGREQHMNVYVNEGLEQHSVRLCAVRTDRMIELYMIMYCAFVVYSCV